MSTEKSNIRIKDIARLAGVSEGTVDRVLHKRGDVSAKSQEAVNKVLKEINYTPNILARSLASKRIYRFIYLIPSYKEGEYWSIVNKGFEKAMQEFSGYNVSFEKACYDQFDVNSFNKVAQSILISQPDAVFIAPIFRDETLKLTLKLSEAGVLFSFIDSVIDEANFLSYYGQNSFLSGYIAAKFLLDGLNQNDKVMVIRTKRKGAVSNQTKARYDGFMHYMEEFGLATKISIIETELLEDNEVVNKALINQIITDNPTLRAAITFNSKVYRFASKLEDLDVNHIKIIGYDLLEENVKFLQKGVVSLLLGQRPENQSYLAAKDMCRKLIFNQDVSRINYMPIDVLIKENIDAYINFDNK
ncbi:MAG: LacI family DNA-binding transcriptional regulator [Paludibacter sp.]|nr:LacI family DNA-binding transcriptional regulator [Paludibacter sp.]